MKDLAVSPLAPTCFPDLPEISGMVASTTRLGLYSGARNDLLLVHFPKGTAIAGAFTTSATRSADVNLCAKHQAGGQATALIVNAGNSNAFTGQAGVDKNDATIAAIQAQTGCAPEQVFIAATGVIGVPLPIDQVANGVPEAFSRLGPPDWEGMARAISTTDTFPKGSGVRLDLDGHEVAISGIAKGSGMIAPSMATMLVFIFTDAAIEAHVLQAMVAEHLHTSFNAITVDSDTSTSDTLLVFATGASSMPRISDLHDPRAKAFSGALQGVMQDLAIQVVRDGEGAQKLIQIEVTGAQDATAARALAMSIANSPLVKTAIAGEDANWGRVAMAIGKAGVPLALEHVAIRFGPVWTARGGGAIDYDMAQVDAHMKGKTIDIGVAVGLGPGQAKVWTCDLTHGYIAINGDYRS